MKLTLINKKQEAPDVVTFEFRSEAPLTWKAGQYMRYHIGDPNPDERRENRFFSISAAPYEGNIKLTTKFVPGDGSTFKRDLQKLNIGEFVEAIGPSGNFIVEDPNKEYIFIAGGIGITPFHSILLDLAKRKIPLKVTLLYANRTPDALFKEELEGLKKENSNLKIVYVIDPERIDETVIRHTIYDIRYTIFYISGPEPMVEAMEAMLYQMGVPRENAIRDYFPGYDQI